MHRDATPCERMLRRIVQLSHNLKVCAQTAETIHPQCHSAHLIGSRLATAAADAAALHAELAALHALAQAACATPPAKRPRVAA